MAKTTWTFTTGFGIGDDQFYLAAAADVYEQEPIPVNHPYLKVLKRERLILTPHIGWSGESAKKRLLEGIAANIESYLQSRSL